MGMHVTMASAHVADQADMGMHVTMVSAHVADQADVNVHVTMVRLIRLVWVCMLPW